MKAFLSLMTLNQLFADVLGSTASSSAWEAMPVESHTTTQESKAKASKEKLVYLRELLSISSQITLHASI